MLTYSRLLFLSYLGSIKSNEIIPIEIHDDNLSEEMRENATSQLSLFLENNSLDSLPVYSREVRPASCAEGVEEELIMYR